MDFVEIKKKDVIEAKYANNQQVRNRLLAYDAKINEHNNGVEARKEEYKQRLEALYGPLIRECQDKIKENSEALAEREENYRNAKAAVDAGDVSQQRIVDHSLREIDTYKGYIEASTKKIEELDSKRNDTSDYAEGEQKYNSFAEIVGDLYESSLVEKSSKYFKGVVRNAREFMDRLNTTITNDVELYNQIRNLVFLREAVELYISKRSSFFGKITSKGGTRLKLVKSLKSLLDEHEEFLQNKYNSLLETGAMSYIDEADEFHIPKTVKELNETKYSKRVDGEHGGKISNYEIHDKMKEYLLGEKALNQKFLNENGNKPDFKMKKSDSRFSQAFTCFRFNQDGTLTGEKDKEIANRYITCIDGDKEVRKAALENVVKDFCTAARDNMKAVMKSMNVELERDKISGNTDVNVIRLRSVFHKLYMIHRFSINFSSLEQMRRGKVVTGYGKEWDDFAAEVFSEKELEPYWKEANYYIAAATAAFLVNFEKATSNIYIDANTLSVVKNLNVADDATMAGKQQFNQEALTDAFRELNS